MEPIYFDVAVDGVDKLSLSVDSTSAAYCIALGDVILYRVMPQTAEPESGSAKSSES